MPDITLHIPENSRFHSSLNEHDLAMREILLSQMRIADPRDTSGIQDNEANEFNNNWLWDYTRVFQVDELEVENIFDTYLLRKNINGKKDTNVTYPILAYKENDIDTLFWGTGNRINQWYFDIPIDEAKWEKGDEVVIAKFCEYRGLRGSIADTRTYGNQLQVCVEINGTILKQKGISGKPEVMWFYTSDLRQAGNKKASRYKAKAITGTYTATILVDNRDEAQYIRDKFMLRCSDAHIWYKYKSPTIDNSENQLYTIFGIPNLERYPSSKDKLKGIGYIYGVTFNINIWGCVTDTPLPAGWIERIRMSIEVEDEKRASRIAIG